MFPTPLFNNSPRNNCLIQKLFLLFSSQTFVCQWKFIYLLQNKDLHSAFASLKLWWPLLRRDRLERFNLKRVSLNRKTRRQTDRLMYVEIFVTYNSCSALCWVVVPPGNFMIRLVLRELYSLVFKHPQSCTKSV